MIAVGDVSGNTLTISGNVAGGNLTTTGQVVATGNVTGGNLLTAGLVNATGNVTGGNVITAGLVDATGNVTAGGNVSGGNLLTAGLVNATGNVTGGNLITSGNAVITGDVTANNLSVTNTSTLGNIIIGGDDITGNGIVTFNAAGDDVNFVFSGNNASNLLVVNGTDDTVLINTGTPVANSLLTVSGSTSMIIPVGNTSQRPLVPVSGMIRFNSQLDQFEFYDNNSWTTAGVEFTVIASEVFYGDGANTVFTLATSQTTASCIVSINGVVQLPVTAYAVTGGTTLTFTQAPEVGDVIEVREITTTTTIMGISNGDGSAQIEASANSADVNVTGNLLPTANVTYSLGSNTAAWSDLYLSGNTIHLGPLRLEAADANTFVVYGASGQQATIDAGAVDVSAITSGTSTIGIAAPNGNAYVTVGGVANVLVTSTTGVNVTGTLDVTGNISGGNVIATGIAGTLSTAAQPNITSVGTLGSLAVTGNVTGGNITTAGRVDATGNVSGGNLNITGNIVDSNALEIITGNNGNITLSPNGTGAVVLSKDLLNGRANGVGNIGSSTGYFNTVFAKATSAQYADLAEMYEADAAIEAGTVVCFGGAKEVQVCGHEEDTRVAGVVSTNPSYLMNSALEAEHVVAVALTGRVPCKVVGPVRKGDLMVSAGNGAAKAKNDARSGSVIGKALADFDGAEGVIEVVVGRF